MFFGFLFTFGGLVGSLWILIQKFLVVGQYIFFSQFDYCNPLITAAENSGGNHCITTSNNTTSNTTNSTGYVDYTFSNNNNNGTNTSCPDDDPHVAQGVAFFLQNFFILLRLVISTTYVAYMYKLKTTIILFVIYSTLIFKFGRTEEDPDSF